MIEKVKYALLRFGLVFAVWIALSVAEKAGAPINFGENIQLETISEPSQNL